MENSNLVLRRSYMPLQVPLTTREEENGEKIIEGYFVVYNQITNLWGDIFEKVAPGAGDKSLKENDIRCLYNHNSDIPLGRMSAKTAEFFSDEKGIFGRVKINPNDQEANDIYERVKRGDITGCSYGYWPIKETYEETEDGTIWTVEEANIIEMSICTFPQYDQTEITARAAEYTREKGQALSRRKKIANDKLKGVKEKC